MPDKYKDVKKFEIDPDVWLRGEGHNSSMLLRESDGKRCCLGIYLGACGIPDKRIAGLGWPDDMASYAGVPEWLLVIASQLTCQLIDINDARSAEAERRRRIAALFKMAGVDVTFKTRKKVAKK